MDPQVSGEGHSPFMTHPAPEQGTWSMQDTAHQEGVPGIPGALGANTPVPQLAADNDLIEREWVEAARALVNANRDDPYKLSKALAALKAEYMRKRYGQQLKLPE